MYKYNWSRPLLILAVGFCAKTVSYTICQLIGFPKELSSDVSMVFMLTAALIVFWRLNSRKRRSK